jgi:LPS export ABC transporter protein LptC
MFFRILTIKITIWWAVFLIVFLSVSCENDMKTIREIGLRDTFPTEIMTDGEMLYSDSGRVQVLVKTPLIKRYDKEKQYMEMPIGVKVFFFDSALIANSWLIAKYAKSYDNDNKLEARKNVIVVNDKGERLDTERLVWDTEKKIIYSDQFVKITTKDKFSRKVYTMYFNFNIVAKFIFHTCSLTINKIVFFI